MNNGLTNHLWDNHDKYSETTANLVINLQFLCCFWILVFYTLIESNTDIRNFYSCLCRVCTNASTGVEMTPSIICNLWHFFLLLMLTWLLFRKDGKHKSLCDKWRRQDQWSKSDMAQQYNWKITQYLYAQWTPRNVFDISGRYLMKWQHVISMEHCSLNRRPTHCSACLPPALHLHWNSKFQKQ